MVPSFGVVYKQLTADSLTLLPLLETYENIPPSVQKPFNIGHKTWEQELAIWILPCTTL